MRPRLQAPGQPWYDESVVCIEDGTLIGSNGGRTCCGKTGAWFVEAFHALIGLAAPVMGNQTEIVARIVAVDRLCWSTSVIERHVAVPWSGLLGAGRYLWFVNPMGRETVSMRCP